MRRNTLKRKASSEDLHYRHRCQCNSELCTYEGGHKGRCRGARATDIDVQMGQDTVTFEVCVGCGDSYDNRMASVRRAA